MSDNGSTENEKALAAGAIDWEVSRALEQSASVRRAWTVAIVAVLVALLAWVAVVLMMPLKQTIPYVVRVDNATGVPDIVTLLEDQVVSNDDVMNKYWLAQYVRARESYDWYTIQATYNTVGLLSSPDVAGEYGTLFEGPNALDKVYSDRIKVTVDVVSVVPYSEGAGTVRFIKRTKRVDDSGPGKAETFTATIAYSYLSTAKTTEGVRLINPFGFQVLSYRADPELTGAFTQ